MNKVMVILRGCPNSGKSTFAEFLEHNIYGTSALVCTDDYFTDDRGNYNFDFNKLGEAHKWAKDMAITFCRANYRCVIIANTNTTEKEFNPYIDIANEFGYTVVSLIVENRHNNKNNHNVPEETLDKMEKRFQIKLR